MKNLVNKIRKIQSTNISKTINQRLKEFSNQKEWFSELCFCILTANSKAKTAIAIQNELGVDGFSKLSQDELALVIRRNKHRFHNNKAKFIVLAREYLDVKEKLKRFNDEKEMREWLVKNIKGLGYKEASHFLRNVGFRNLAILDRHIINLLSENKLIEKPKSLNRKNYLDIEKVMEGLCSELDMNQAELDMHMWYMKTGEVLK